MSEPREDHLLDVAITARRLNVCEETIRRYIRKGLLKAVRTRGHDTRGGNYRIAESEVRAMLDRGAMQYGDRRTHVKRTGVYFIEGAGLIKIGAAMNILSRLSALSSSSPVPLTLVGWIPVEPRKILSAEQMAHDHFADRRARGEWFVMTVESAIRYIREQAGTVGRLDGMQQLTTRAQLSNPT